MLSSQDTKVAEKSGSGNQVDEKVVLFYSWHIRMQEPEVKLQLPIELQEYLGFDKLEGGLIGLFVFATGALTKLEPFADRANFPVTALNPVQESGQAESTALDPKEVAREKTSRIRTALEKSRVENPRRTVRIVIYGADICVDIIQNEGTNQEKRTSLHRLSRTLDFGDEEGVLNAQNDTITLFCQGAFVVIWKAGFSLEKDDGTLQNFGEIVFRAEFSSLQPEVVTTAFLTADFLQMATRVDLIDLLKEYAGNQVSVSETLSDGTERWVPTDPKMAKKVIVEGHMPQRIFDKLAVTVDAGQPHEVHFSHQDLLEEGMIQSRV